MEGIRKDGWESKYESESTLKKVENHIKVKTC